MKEIKVQDAVGQILCHDVTQIVRSVVKDAKFRKGHIITGEDIPELLKLGKENIFVWENDAAEILRQVTQGENLSATDIKEGKIELKATCDGVFHVDADKFDALERKFCGNCNRIRLTAEGFLKTCLSFDIGLDVKNLLRSDFDDEKILAAIHETIYRKPREHNFGGTTTFQMYQVGG